MEEITKKLYIQVEFFLYYHHLTKVCLLLCYIQLGKRIKIIDPDEKLLTFRNGFHCESFENDSQ